MHRIDAIPAKTPEHFRLRHCLVVADEVSYTGQIDWGFAARYAPELFSGKPYGYLKNEHEASDPFWVIEIIGTQIGRQSCTNEGGPLYSLGFRSESFDHFLSTMPSEYVILVSAADFELLEPLFFPGEPKAYEPIGLVVKTKDTVRTCWTNNTLVVYPTY